MVQQLIDFIEILNKNGFFIYYKINNITNNLPDKYKEDEYIGYFNYNENISLTIYEVNKERVQNILTLEEMICNEIKVTNIDEKMITNILEIAKTISPETELDETFELLLEKISVLLGFKGGSLYLYKEGELIGATTYNSIEVKDAKIGIENSLLGLAAIKKLPVSMNEAHRHPKFKANFILDDLEIKNVMNIPLLVENDLFGVISFVNKDFISIKDFYVSFLISEIISSIIDVSVKETKLKSILFSTLEALLKAQNSRIIKSEDFENKVQELAVKVAKQLELMRDDIRILELSTYIYDIGEIGIPNRILSKNGPLNYEEFDIVKSHVKLGYQLVEKIPNIPNKLKEIVLYHHERWNGEGYPEGLKENEIPLLAQIIGVCDTFIAMTETKPYRNAIPKDKALEILKNYSGIFFNPTIVQTLCEVIA